MPFVLPRIINWIFVTVVFVAAAGISTYLTVHLLIRSENAVVVPDLAAKEVVYALELLSDLGLNTKVKASDYSNTVPRHHIISQDPEPGTEIKKGRDVRLVISKGPRTVVVPNLSGITLAQVRIYLAENGLHQGVISYTDNSEKPKDEVLTQYPHPGSAALRGDSVDLLISAGRRTERIAMADFTTLNLNQAIEAIEQRQLRVKTIQTVHRPGVQNDSVVSHSPASGYPVTAGSSVELTINRRQRQMDQDPRQSVTLFRYRIEPGLLRTHVRISSNRPESSMDLFDAFTKPGREIWLIIPRDRPSTLLLYTEDELIKTVHYD
jgi:serine/threonine-protein kinase